MVVALLCRVSVVLIVEVFYVGASCSLVNFGSATNCGWMDGSALTV